MSNMSATPTGFHPSASQSNPAPPPPTATPSDPSPTDRTSKTKRKKTHPCTYGCKDKDGALRMFSCHHNVLQHVREKHTQERPYRCRLCGDSHRGFNRPYTFNRHMYAVHRIKTGPGKGHGVRRTREVAVEARGADEQVEEEFDGLPAQLMAFIHGSTPDNFPLEPIQCHACKLSFEHREAVFAHLHHDHGVEASPFCPCVLCDSVFRGTGEDAAVLEQRLQEGGFEVMGTLPRSDPSGSLFQCTQNPGREETAFLMPVQSFSSRGDMLEMDGLPVASHNDLWWLGEGNPFPNLVSNNPDFGDFDIDFDFGVVEHNSEGAEVYATRYVEEATPEGGFESVVGFNTPDNSDTDNALGIHVDTTELSVVGGAGPASYVFGPPRMAHSEKIMARL